MKKGDLESITDHQISFFELIRANFTSAEEAADSISRMLNVERSALYNRLSGKKRLSVDEAIRLSRNYGVPYPGITEAVLSPGTVPVRFGTMQGQPEGAKDFLLPLAAQLDQIAHFPQVVLHYVTSEIPLFYYLHFPRLADFKFYVWTYFTWSDIAQSVKRSPFQMSGHSPEVAALYATVRQGYDIVSSIEIWHVNILDNTLNQLNYLHSVGLVSSEDAECLLKEIGKMLELVSLRAERGAKTKSATFVLYQNEVTHTNNVVLVEAGEQSIVYFTYDNPNLASSLDRSLVSYTRDAIRRLMRNCTNLSHGSDRQRRLFFNLLSRRIEETRQQLHLSEGEL